MTIICMKADRAKRTHNYDSKLILNVLGMLLDNNRLERNIRYIIYSLLLVSLQITHTTYLFFPYISYTILQNSQL